MIELLGDLTFGLLLGLQLSIGFAPYLKNEYRGGKNE